MSKLTCPPGTSDIFPEEAQWWRFLENTARKIFPLYGYGELRTPVFEYTEVFERGLGNETEVVQKEMYTFKDKGGRSLTLRPEGTAGVMRALLATDVMNGTEQRVFYIGPMFRGERPAAGRRRQFHQIGVENAGSVSPEADAECISMLAHYLESLGITGSKFLINTRGSFEDRKPASDALKDYFKDKVASMCDDCKGRLDRNVWRILDCKQPQCKEFIEKVPDITQFFSQATRDYFKKVVETLEVLKVDFDIEPRLVRGLDYYVHTVFEITHPGLGAQNAIAGGGRYEVFLPETSKPIKGVGFAMGMERLLLSLESLNAQNPEKRALPVFLAWLGKDAKETCMRHAMDLRKSGIPAVVELEEKSLKSQMRSANRLNAAYVLICGENEINKGSVSCKDMKTGTQEDISFASLSEYFKERY